MLFELSLVPMNVQKVRDSTVEGRAEKLKLARQATLPVLKLIGTTTNEDLRSRLEATWTNLGVLSAFVASVSVSFLFASVDVNSSDKDANLKMNVRSAFYTLAAIATMLLILAVALVVINLITLLVCPNDFVDDLIVSLGALEGIPSVLMIISIVSIVAIVPMYMFIMFGSGPEFIVSIVISIGAIVSGLGYQLTMMKVQNTILDRSLEAAEIQNKQE